MIYDWYNGGEWGGLPVRRLGHIMADLINSADDLYALIKAGLPLGETNPLAPLGFMRDMTTGFAILGNGVNAQPDWFDGIPIAGKVDSGSPMSINYRNMYNMFNRLCTVQTEDMPQFMQDDYETVITMDYLGLGDFDENSLTRPQQVDVWAAFREAFGKLRYYRGQVKNTLTPRTGAGFDLSVGGTSKDVVNAALVPLWAALSYSEAPPRGYALSRVNASVAVLGDRAASVHDDDSFTVSFRGSDGLESLPFDRPVMRGYLKFDGQIGYDKDFTTDRGTLSAGWEDDFGYGVESVDFESTITRPHYFVDEFPDSGEQTYGARANMDATCHAVWDIDAEDYPS